MPQLFNRGYLISEVIKMKKYKKNDLVRVNEAPPGQSPIYWKGKIITPLTNSGNYEIRDVNPHSTYYKETFWRNEFVLTPWDNKDNVNV